MVFWDIFWTLLIGVVTIGGIVTVPRVKTARDMMEERFPEVKYTFLMW